MSFNKEKKVIHNLRTEVDSFGRKKYRLEEVIKSGGESQSENQNAVVVDTGRHKSMLIGREQGLNIDKYIGKIETNKKKKVTEVFYCDVCSEGFKCDMAYITHINSPAHNRKLGMSMKVKNVSLETVSSKISALINRKLGKVQKEQEQEEIIRKMQNKDSRRENRLAAIKKQLNQTNGNEQGDQQEDDIKDQEQNSGQEQQEVKEQEGQDLKEQQAQQGQQEELDSNELAEQEMMMQMGFGKKKQKR